MKKVQTRRVSSPVQNFGNYNSTPSPKPAAKQVHEKRYSMVAQPYQSAKHLHTNTADTAIKPYKTVRKFNPPKEIYHDHSLSQSQILVNRDDSIERTDQKVL